MKILINPQQINNKKIKFSQYLDFSDGVSENDVKKLFINIEHINDFTFTDKMMLKHKYFIKNEYKYSYFNVFQNLIDIKQANITLGNLETHPYEPRNINLTSPMEISYEDEEYVAVISNMEDYIKFASVNKKWASCHVEKYRVISRRRDGFIVFFSRKNKLPSDYVKRIVNSDKDTMRRFASSNAPEGRFYVLPLYSKRANESVRGVVIGLYPTSFYPNENNVLIRRICRFLTEKFRIVESLFDYSVNYILSNRIVNGTINSKIEKKFIKLLRDEFFSNLRESFDFALAKSDLRGAYAYFILPFPLKSSIYGDL